MEFRVLKNCNGEYRLQRRGWFWWSDVEDTYEGRYVGPTKTFYSERSAREYASKMLENETIDRHGSRWTVIDEF